MIRILVRYWKIVNKTNTNKLLVVDYYYRLLVKRVLLAWFFVYCLRIANDICNISGASNDKLLILDF